MCMKPCANTKQICSWQLWARTSILVFSALLPRLPALEEYLGFRSPPPSSLPFLSSQKGEVRYSPNSCKREQRLQRRSGSDTHTPPPPRGPCALPGAEGRGPRGALPAGAELHGALLPSCARRPPAAAGGPGSAGLRQLSGGTGAGGGVSCTARARCRAPRLAFLGLHEGGGRAGPRGETDAKMVRMRRSNFFG